MEHTRESLLIHFGASPSNPAGQHESGGQVKNPGRRRPPLCKNCKSPLHRVLALDLRSPELNLRIQELERATVLTCMNCDGYHEPLRYRHLGHAAGIQVLSQESGESFGDFPAVIRLRAVSLRPADQTAPSCDERLHQVGGEPLWLDEEVQPACSTCGDKMQFLAQIDSDPSLGWSFGNAGMLYSFFCAGCREFASFVQDS